MRDDTAKSWWRHVSLIYYFYDYYCWTLIFTSSLSTSYVSPLYRDTLILSTKLIITKQQQQKVARGM